MISLCSLCPAVAIHSFENRCRIEKPAVTPRFALRFLITYSTANLLKHSHKIATDEAFDLGGFETATCEPRG